MRRALFSRPLDLLAVNFSVCLLDGASGPPRVLAFDRVVRKKPGFKTFQFYRSRRTFFAVPVGRSRGPFQTIYFFLEFCLTSRRLACLDFV